MRTVLFINFLLPFFLFGQQHTGTVNSLEAMTKSVHADNLVKMQQLEAALLEYDNVIEIAPDYVDAYMRRAVLLSRMGRLPEAMQDYNTAKQLDPYVVEVFDIYGRINKLKVLKGVTITNTEDASKELIEIQKLLKEDANNPILLFNSANLKVLLGAYQSAVEDYSKAILLEKNYVEAIYNRGIVYIILNNKSAACDDFSASSHLGSTRAEKKYNFFCKK